MEFAIALAVVALIRPFLWLVVLTTLVWLGRMFLSDRMGSALFGRYWRKKSGLLQRSGYRSAA